MGSGSSNLHNLSPEEKSFIAADLKVSDYYMVLYIRWSYVCLCKFAINSYHLQRKYEELALSGITEAERYEALAMYDSNYTYTFSTTYFLWVLTVNYTKCLQ